MSNFVHRYQQELHRCRQRFEALNLHKEKGYSFKLTLFSANMQNILPDISTNKHEVLFQKMLLHQVYNTFDQQFLSANDLLQTEGPVQDLIRSKRPHIYCTFHLGSYRLLTSYLYRQGVDLALLVGSSVYQQQSNTFWETIHGLQKKHNLSNSFQVLDAEQSSSTLQIIRALRAGTSLVIYIDGLTSTTGVNRQEDKELQVRIGNKHLWVRKGVGFLSYVTQTPIIPVINHREKNLTNVLSFLDPIQSDASVDRETYCQQSLQLLYDSFWKYLRKYPDQWEGWTYIHNFLDQQELNQQLNTGSSHMAQPIEKAVFNNDRYTICDQEETPVLLDRRLYVTYEISTDLHDFLTQVHTIDSPEEVLGPELYADLLAKQILI